MQDCENEDECDSESEAFFSFQDKTLYTDIPVVIDHALTAQNCVCGEVVRDDKGAALRIVLGEHVDVKKMTDISPAYAQKINEVKMVKRFIFMMSAS